MRVASRVRASREGLTPERRAALKSRVLRRLDVAPRPSFRERLALALLLVARPLPIVYRAGVAAVLVAAIAAGASVASADSVPDDALYGVKLASEQMRLSLAQNPRDVAAVELTIAETRLREASQLAAQQRDAEADVAASAFGEHLANAVANLQRARPQDVALLRQLQQRVTQQQREFLDKATGATPNAVSILSSAARAIAAASPNAGSIADAAARAAEQAADLVIVEADDEGDVTARLGATPTFAPPTLPPGSSRASNGPGRTASPASARNARPSASLDPKQKAKLDAAVKAARQAAERARAAADRAQKDSDRDSDKGSDEDR